MIRHTDDGCVVALDAFGTQDKYIQESGDAYFDPCGALTRWTKSISLYRKLDYKISGHVWKQQQHAVWKFSIEPTCTFVNELDVVFRDPAVTKAVIAFETEVGGQRIDRIGSPDGSHEDFLTELTATCAMLGAPLPTAESLPVCMAPFYRFNAMAKSLFETDELTISIHFSFELSPSAPDMSLMGVCHFLDTVHPLHDRRHLVFNTVQHQLVRSPEDENSLKVSLNCLNHPVYALLFWGHDPDADYRVSLTLTSADLFVEPIPIGALRRRARSKGVVLERGVDVILFAHDHDFSKRPNGLINFSRINEAELVLLDGPECAKLRVVALNAQTVHIMNGMCGIVFR